MIWIHIGDRKPRAKKQPGDYSTIDKAKDVVTGKAAVTGFKTIAAPNNQERIQAEKTGYKFKPEEIDAINGKNKIMTSIGNLFRSKKNKKKFQYTSDGYMITD